MEIQSRVLRPQMSPPGLEPATSRLQDSTLTTEPGQVFFYMWNRAQTRRLFSSHFGTSKLESNHFGSISRSILGSSRPRSSSARAGFGSFCPRSRSAHSICLKVEFGSSHFGSRVRLGQKAQAILAQGSETFIGATIFCNRQFFVLFVWDVCSSRHHVTRDV